jgi:putative outer membrane protein
MKYQFVHADFMYNLTHNLQCNEYGLSKFDVIPYIGVGMIRNSSNTPGYFLTDNVSSGNHPFAFSYGIELRYLLTDRLHLVGEVSGMTTMNSFDCVGTSNRFGDHMLSASLGLSYTIGKRGWKKVIDARPYISQNNFLMERYGDQSQHANNIETTEATCTEKNNYSGLNSLRYRMSLGNDGTDSNLDSLSQNTKVTIGVPVYFYFKLNTAKLVDKSQLANLDEIAKIAKEQNLTIHISGAADKATGSNKCNRHLSIERAKYIGKQLMKRGVRKDSMKATSLGGINQFSLKEANRFGVVLLTL